MVWADIRPDPERRSLICLFVGSNGPTVAHDVRVVIEPRVVSGPNETRCDQGQDAAASGIASLPPGRTLIWTLGVGHELLDVANQPEAFTVTITGRASDGTLLEDRFVSRFGDIRYTSAADGPVEDIAQQRKHLLSEVRTFNRVAERVAGRRE